MFRRIFLDYRAWLLALVVMVLFAFPILVFGEESEPMDDYCDLNWWDPECTNFCEIYPTDLKCTGEEVSPPRHEGYPAPVEPYPAPISILIGLNVSKDSAEKCDEGYDHKVGSPPWKWTAPAGSIIKKVIIKAGNACFKFTDNETRGCYKVSGIGKATAKAERVGEPGPDCQEISHVSFFIEDKPSPPTDTPTIPTNTPEDTPTTPPEVTPTETELPGTPTATEPGDIPTPTPTDDPENTPTDISETPGVSPTPEGTEPPPPEKKEKKPTPIVLLPATGMSGPGGNDRATFIATFAGVGLLGLILIINGLRKRSR